LGEDGGDVSEAGHEGTAMDVVEWLGIGPFVFGIVDLKIAVWWDAAYGESRSGTRRKSGSRKRYMRRGGLTKQAG